MPFLTELDGRAEVKGSRDPLGLVPVWARLGREVVGNLTTVTGAVRGFTTLLVGLELADLLLEQYRDEAPSRLDTFLKFEQVAGYARVKHQSDKDVRGYRRVSRRLSEDRRIRISAEPADQILSSQKTYGLWGLFSVPARSSGLLEAGQQRLTAAARDFVHRHYVPMLGNGRGVKSVLEMFRRESFDLQGDGRDAALLESIARMHSRRLRAEERDFYRDHLAWGGPADPTHGRQRALADLLGGIEQPEFGFDEFRAVQRRARKNESLSVPLEKIGRLERLIAPSALLFGFLQDRDKQTVAAIAQQIGDTWKRPLRLDLPGLRELQPQIAEALQSHPESELWMGLAQALADGQYPRVIDLLVAINTAVMQRRHEAAAWVVIEGGRLRVRLTDERAELTSVEDAENRWRSTYFINSLWKVAREVRA